MCSYNNKAKAHTHSNSNTYRVLTYTSNYTEGKKPFAHSSKERAIELVENSYSIGPAVSVCVIDG